jgi:hypothetical protein
MELRRARSGILAMLYSWITTSRKTREIAVAAAVAGAVRDA